MTTPTTHRPTAGPPRRSTGSPRPVPDRERTAARLLSSSAKASFDPDVEVDWDAPLDPAKPCVPWQSCSLYGTGLWDGLSPRQRLDLTRHEVASIASVGIWFELILMQMLVRDTYRRDPRSLHSRYSLVEVADECRHSNMFARMIEKLGCPAYGPGPLAHHLGRWFKATASGTLVYAGALYVEELLDSLQRRAMNDAEVQPLVRHVSRIHVVEESRHISYAREEALRRWSRKGPLQRAYERLVLARVVHIATNRLIHPDVYRAVGLDPREARRAARRNPVWRTTLAQAASAVLRDFDRMGMVSAPARLLWRRTGVWPPPAATG